MKIVEKDQINRAIKYEEIYALKINKTGGKDNIVKKQTGNKDSQNVNSKSTRHFK